jgi:hypothetical protein
VKKGGTYSVPAIKKRRMGDLERLLLDVKTLLTTMYIPDDSNEVVVDGLRVFYNGRSKKRDAIVNRIDYLIQPMEEVEI